MFPTHSSAPGPQIEHLFIYRTNKARSPTNPWKKNLFQYRSKPGGMNLFREEGGVRSINTCTDSMTRLVKINKNQFYMSFLSEFVTNSSVKESIKLDKGLGFNKEFSLSSSTCPINLAFSLLPALLRGHNLLAAVGNGRGRFSFPSTLPW